MAAGPARVIRPMAKPRGRTSSGAVGEARTTKAVPKPARSLSVNCDILAVNVPGIGSGWQQSKQNWAAFGRVAGLKGTPISANATLVRAC
jgi:hypothetical protein